MAGWRPPPNTRSTPGRRGRSGTTTCGSTAATSASPPGRSRRTSPVPSGRPRPTSGTGSRSPRSAGAVESSSPATCGGWWAAGSVTAACGSATTPRSRSRRSRVDGASRPVRRASSAVRLHDRTDAPPTAGCRPTAGRTASASTSVHTSGTSGPPGVRCRSPAEHMRPRRSPSGSPPLTDSAGTVGISAPPWSSPPRTSASPSGSASTSASTPTASASRPGR